MTLVYLAANALSISVFLYFGASSLLADGMRADFERFGLSRLRLLTGALELVGALGLLVGLIFHTLAIVSAVGLALLMSMGVAVRIRQRDSVLQMLPAGCLIVVNLYIAWHALGLRSA
ncbi:MAG: DoxX family protein [Gemmatimonadaceae bacterium]|nr:DoxX family protein [Gemmatimonadaceae bacterium]